MDLLNDPTAWDDSELIESWDQAVEEYKKYHSLAAEGKEISMEELKRLEKELAQVDGTVKKEAEEAEVPEEYYEGEEGGEEEGAYEEEVLDEDALYEDPEETKPQTAQPTSAQINTPQAPSQIPQLGQALLGNVKDEALKNMLMSWWYAGYYTGLYEGQQNAAQNGQQGSANGVPSPDVIKKES